MRTVVLSCLVALSASRAFAQSPDPPLDEKRLPIATLLREDVFAGWRAGDMERYARGEKNIDLLLQQRPNERTELLAWKGATKLYRAVVALEAGDKDAFDRYYRDTLELFGESRKLGPQHPAVAAIVGGSWVVFADRLPETLRPAAWSESYECYQTLWKQQQSVMDKLPLHLRGELLAGLAQSAERTGHKEQVEEYLDKIIEALPDTGYERVAKQWKADPASSARTNISCKSCHNEGRLSERLAKLKDR